MAPSKRPHAGGSGATLALAVGNRELVVRRFQISVTAGADQGRTATSDGMELTAGTSDGNDLVLTDPTVSRHHFVIAATDAGFLLRDLGSTNGTRLAGCRVESALLEPDALLRVGETTLRFEVRDDSISEPLSEDDRYGSAIGRSAPMRRIFALLPRVAASEAVVLIEGETGTGKTLLAQALHGQSSRSRGPFAVLDCSTIPPTLIESELFGHEKGAFTGAHVARAGIFESAGGGTVFLDEIGELPLELQPKLLRALEERTVKRIGSQTEVRLDVRIIAATNRDLREMVNRGTFRPDLFYRLNVMRLRIPPLRERRDDIPLLVEYFWKQFAKDAASRPPAELMTALLGSDLRGNVRELRSAVERAVLLEDPELWRDLSTEDSPMPAGAAPDYETFDPAVPFRLAKERMTARWERWYVGELLRRSGRNLTAAARIGRMDRGYLRELLKQHKVPLPEGDD